MKKEYALLISVVLSDLISGNLHAFEFKEGWTVINIPGFISQGYLHNTNNNYYTGTKDGWNSAPTIPSSLPIKVIRMAQAQVSPLMEDQTTLPGKKNLC
ncbi:hypothetical protein CSA56_02180 [candidate division KSB3 bacterium]|uniref:Uncharacterized protein n=1 Tax=candidate division KSB3 bacterium TaxID=2044937 RepID=A0A2G6KLN8_9BACT|nr:MAG: hypothetical protein CSA56_02180 [candidate division KSB3 bacterium]